MERINKELNNKTAYCINCKREVPIIIKKQTKKGKEILQIGKCIFCLNEITLIEVV